MSMYRYPVKEVHIPGLPQEAYRLGVGLFEFVTMHDTGTDGDSAAAESNYEHGNWNKPGAQAFVAEFVDAVTIYQVASPMYRQWGAGPTANSESVHLELCHAKSLGEFRAAYDRWVSRAACYLFARGLGVVDNVTLRSHREVSADWHETDHQDPDGYLARWGYTWKDVLDSVKHYYAMLQQEAEGGSFAALPGIPEQCITNPLIPGHNTVKRPVLIVGSPYVIWVELLQKDLGMTGSQVDGAFGPMTKAALEKFQAEHHLPATGTVDQATWDALDASKVPAQPATPPPNTKPPDPPANATTGQPGPNPAILYVVQVGAYTYKANAERLKAELQGKGYQAFVTIKGGK